MRWRHAIAAAAVLALAGAGAEAQELSGRAVDLVFKTAGLVTSVTDLVFKIENTAGQVQSLQVKETKTETRIELPADILFDFDKADIRAGAQGALKQAADMLRERAKGTVLVEGHTDSKGTPAYNQRLSERRADAVRKWLVEREAVRNVKFAVKGFGATRPVAANVKPDGSDDPPGRQKNRRVEIVFGKR